MRKNSFFIKGWSFFKRYRSSIVFIATFSAMLLMIVFAVLSATTVPNEIEQPGTQPGEVGTFTSPDNCDNCHDDAGSANRQFYPGFGWRGGMMANAGRDALFWATLAIAEQDFIAGSNPNTRGGAGDLCIRCHSVGGWLAGHSTPTDGSGLSDNSEADGVECEFCHLLVNPDQPVNITGTSEIYNTPFEAFDLVTGEAHYGTGQYVINGAGQRLGPYAENDANAKHQRLGSPFHRQGQLCGTCHDVSNPAVGDLAHNNGAQIPLEPGTFSGVLGSSITQKAAFNNPPYKYGIVERTSSEWTASDLDTFLVNNYNTLPADLRVPGGSLDIAYHRAYDAHSNANYVDGAQRYFTCQTCHMSASTGLGCNKQGTPTRTDLPRHDQTGSGYWMPDVVKYMDTRGTLRLGNPLTQTQKDALDAGKLRAEGILKSAVSLSANQVGNDLVVRTTNLTGHKFISGYPEGRRAWINIKWYDSVDQLIKEDGEYGTIGRSVNDLNGIPHQVESLKNLYNTHIYEVHPGMDKQWANQLLSLGYDPNLALMYDRMTDSVEHTLNDLGTAPDGTAYHTFHFVLNNVVVSDNRIPPYGFKYNEAQMRNCLPVPVNQFGAPGAGGTYNYWDEVPFLVPANAARAEVRIYYQQTSWEYIQFLWLNNDQLNTFLASEGDNMLDAWLNTGMSPPLELAFFETTVTGGLGTPGEASHQWMQGEQMLASYNQGTGLIDITYFPACDASDHTIYFGDLSSVSTYSYSNAVCDIGVSGSASFDPGAGSVFFLIVGNNGSSEGTYGMNSIPAERPEASGITQCEFPQDLGGVICE